jgi:CRP/FNR family cyclic AMP-dependent transcriptional regulator
MACDPAVLTQIPLFSLLDQDELAILAAQVELKTFALRQRIYKRGEPGGRAYVLVSGTVRVTTVDEDHQDVLVEEPHEGDFFGFASMIEESAHQTDALAETECVCVEIDRHDIATLLQKKPHAGMDLLTILGRQLHAAQKLARGRSARNANDIIEGETTFGQKIADRVARFGGSWSFIITFFVVLVTYTALNVGLGKSAWDPYPFILLNLFLSMLAAIQAPVIMMSQNRQDEKDRVRGELDYEVNRRSETQIRGLAEKMTLLNDKLADMEDLLREQKH